MRSHTILFTLLPSLALALDLTPRPALKLLDEVSMPAFELRDDRGSFTFQLLEGWQANGSQNVLRLTPPAAGQARVELHLQSAPPAEPSAEGDLANSCRKFLPSLATQIEVVSNSVNPFILRGIGSHEYTFTYAFQSRKFTTSVAVMALDEKQRLALVVTDLSQNFCSLHESAIRTLFSFEWKPYSAAR